MHCGIPECGCVRLDPKEAVISPLTRTCPRRTARQQHPVGPQTSPAAGAAARGTPSRYRAPSDPSTHPRSVQPPPRSPIPIPHLPAPRCGLRVPPAPVPLRGHRPLFPFHFPFPSPLRRRSAPAPPARSCGESSAPDPRGTGSPKANGSGGGKGQRR